MDPLKDTAEWKAPLYYPGDGESPTWTPARVTIDAAGSTHQGLIRPSNEDHFLVSRFGRFLEAVQSNLPADDVPPCHELTGNAYLIADGLGGHAAGEMASRSAIRILFNLVADTPDWIFRLDQGPLIEEVERRAALRFEQISKTMTNQADADRSLRGFGTTLTAVWGIGAQWLLAHVGDSRAYRFRQGVLRQLTHDDTVAQALADLGLIDQLEVPLHRLRNQLTQLLGDNVLDVIPMIEPFTVQDDDCLLLCTDGLTDMVPNDTIAGILSMRQPAADCCRQLVDAALQAGGRDNVTVIFARLRLDDGCVA